LGWRWSWYDWWPRTVGGGGGAYAKKKYIRNPGKSTSSYCRVRGNYPVNADFNFKKHNHGKKAKLECGRVPWLNAITYRRISIKPYRDVVYMAEQVVNPTPTIPRGGDGSYRRCKGNALYIHPDRNKYGGDGGSGAGNGNGARPGPIIGGRCGGAVSVIGGDGRGEVRNTFLCIKWSPGGGTLILQLWLAIRPATVRWNNNSYR
jgi:hypothetical protein